jgi:nitrilase
VSAASENHVFVALAFSHKLNESIYMAQALISPEGQVLELRHKLRPSGIERSFWSDGTTNGLKVLNTTLGRVGLLECWEYDDASAELRLLL